METTSKAVLDAMIEHANQHEANARPQKFNEILGVLREEDKSQVVDLTMQAIQDVTDAAKKQEYLRALYPHVKQAEQHQKNNAPA